MIHVCVPVLRRYDLLRDLLLSLKASTVRMRVIVINNGRDREQLELMICAAALNAPVTVKTPDVPMGVAESWNWFIRNVPEERVIANDDVTFSPDSLKALTASSADLAFAQGCGFSCFALRDSCVRKIGLFDEAISPGYGYYEDEDYLQRIDGKGTRPPTAGVRLADVECGVVHLKSQTLAGKTPEEMNEHHRRFWIAQCNYVNKWNLQREFR